MAGKAQTITGLILDARDHMERGTNRILFGMAYHSYITFTDLAGSIQQIAEFVERTADDDSTKRRKGANHMSEIRIGDRVKYINLKNHKKYPQYYPKPGTIGIVKDIDKDGDLLIQWPDGSTSCEDTWLATTRSVMRVEE